jgi:hypothetical protein
VLGKKPCHTQGLFITHCMRNTFHLWSMVQDLPLVRGKLIVLTLSSIPTRRCEFALKI